MGMTASLVALALWGADPVPPAVEPGEMITCEVEVMTIEGLAWRAKCYPMLKPAARQGTATIWTADRALKAILEKESVGKTFKAPKVTSAPLAVATVNSDETQDYIRHVQRVSDGPINGSTELSFVPELGTIRQGFSATYSGQRLDQGVMARVKFAEAHVGALHTFPLFEQIVATKPTTAGTAPQPTNLQTTVQIPEVFLSEIQGQWLVPNDGILLISAGVNTVANAEGKAVVHERLAILDFGGPTEPACNAQSAMLPACRVDGNTAVAMENAANLSMPRVPDRSFPEARDKDGNVYELPPLPEAYASNDLNQISPGSPLASAQSLPINQLARGVADPALARTSLEAIPDGEIQAWPTEPCPTGLAAVVESFLRTGMPSAACPALEPTPSPALAPVVADVKACDDPAFTAEGCPFSAAVVESFLRMGTPNPTCPALAPVATDAKACDDPACTAEGCPFAAQGCDETKAKVPAVAPSQVTMGVSVQNSTGTNILDYKGKLSTVFQKPGTPEVQYIPLSNGLSLQIQAKVVATPASNNVATAGQPAQR